MAHLSPFIATGIKNSFIFFLKKKIWLTAQILFIFCKSLECHIINPKIGDYLSTAVRDHLNVFCSIMATSLLQYPLLTQLHWRRTMIQWSTCWRKSLTVSTSSRYVLTLNWWIFYWNSSLDLPSNLAFCACGTVGTDPSTISRRTGLQEMKWCRVDQTTLSTILWWTDTKYSCHRYTSGLAWLNSSPKPWTRMVVASLTCAMFFQDYPLRNWKLAFLMVLKFVSLSEILSLRSQWPHWNWKHGKPLFWLWKIFWVTTKPVIMKSLSPTCFMLSKT